MKASGELTRLCVSWWTKLTDSTKDEQQEYAKQFLELLGWSTAAPIDLHGDAAALSYLLRGNSQTAVATYFLMPGALESPTAIQELRLDFCRATRDLVTLTRPMQVQYAFVTDMYRAYLYDIQSDELLLFADSPMEINHTFIDVLTRADIDRGALEELRREPRSVVARQLREWCLRWCETLVKASHQDKDTAFQAIDRLLVLRFLFNHDILRRYGKRMRQRYEDLVARAFSENVAGCGKGLITLFHDFALDWKASLFLPVRELDDALQNDELAALLIREFSMLSDSKFSVATILESFNFGDATEKARVRMVPDLDEEREQYLNKLTVDTVDGANIEVDVADEGYRSVFAWFDTLVSHCQRVAREFERTREARQADEGTEGLDLFAWSEQNAQCPDAVLDTYRWIIDQGMTVYYGSPRQLRTARLMLYLHVIDRYHRSKIRFTGFPDMNAALNERPALVGGNRKWVYAAQHDPAKDEWEVS